MSCMHVGHLCMPACLHACMSVLPACLSDHRHKHFLNNDFRLFPYRTCPPFTARLSLHSRLLPFRLPIPGMPFLAYPSFLPLHHSLSIVRFVFQSRRRKS